MLRSFLKFLSIEATPETAEDTDVDSVRRIVKSLESLEATQAHYVALFASILSRVAHSDLDISDAETKAIEEVVRKVGHLGEELAVLVTGIAKHQNQLLGGVENYLITREFGRVATVRQKMELMESLFIVAAAEEGISAEENQEIRKIAEEIGLSHQDFLAVRSSFKQHLNVLKS